MPIEDVPLEAALDLVLTDDLRTLDSIQLAAVLAVGEEYPDLQFVTADRELGDVANEAGLDTTIPGISE